MKVKDYKLGGTIHVSDKMQTGYSYILSAKYGKQFHKDFNPQLTPKQILDLGAFEGKYLNDCAGELPEEWYKSASKKGKLSPAKANPAVNAFGIKSRLSLHEWRKRGWIPIVPGDKDVRGWFQWYCRYYIGRRDPNVDIVQIKRWRSYKRHLAQVVKNCKPGDITCRLKQRQGLLQWAYDPFV